MLRLGPIVLLLVVLCGCGGATRVGNPSGDSRTLTLVNPIDDDLELIPFAQEVDRLSKGHLHIRLVPGGHLDRTDGEQAAIAGVRDGRYDLGWASNRAWKGSLRALIAPMLVDSYALEERIASDPLAARMLGELRPLGLVGLGILPGPIRRPIGYGDRLVAPRDFRGRTIGEQGSPVAVSTLRALGADPVALPVSVRPEHLGELDGLESQILAIFGRRLDVAGSHATTNVDLWPRPLVLFGNAATIGKLSADQRRILRDAAASAIAKTSAVTRATEKETTDNLCRTGRLTFDRASAADLRALRAAVAPVYRELERDPATREAIRSIEAMKRDLAAPAAALPACAGSTAPNASARTRLDGTWRMDTGRKAAAPDFLDENWGHWIFVFDRGHFAITQENHNACTWGYGTFSVDGDKTTWRFADGGGKAPNGANNKPGEEVAFALSLFRDTATFKHVAGAISPDNFIAEPWRKLGPPSRAHMSAHCRPPAAALPR